LRIYAETNFLLEYVFDQEQSRSFHPADAHTEQVARALAAQL